MGPNMKGALFGLAAFGLYATHDVVVKYLGALYSPIQVFFFSVLFGFPLVTLMLLNDRQADTIRPRHPWWALLRMGAILISSVSAFYAFSVLPLAQTYAILFAAPLFITLLSIPILGEKVGLHRGLAVIAGLVGVLIVLRPGGAELSLGHLAALVSAMAFSVASIVVRRIGRAERDVVLLLLPMLANCLILGALMPFQYRPMPLFDLGAIALIALLAFVAMSCMIAAYKAGEAAIVAPMHYSQIIWATFYGALFFDELPDRGTLLGAAVIIASGLYIVMRESRGNVSDNTPVLRTRSRVGAGTILRIGPVKRGSPAGK